MRIKYIGNRPREIAGPRRLVVKPGEVVEVGDTLGKSLIQQERRFQPVADSLPKPKPEPKAKMEPESTKEND